MAVNPNRAFESGASHAEMKRIASGGIPMSEQEVAKSRLKERQSQRKSAAVGSSGRVHSKHRAIRGAATGAMIGSAFGAPEVGAGIGAAGGAAVSAGSAVTGAATAPITGATGFVTKHSSGGVLTSGMLLLILATWAGFWKPTLIDTAWNGQPWKTPIDGRMILGGIVFIIVLAMIAGSSDEAHSLIVWTMVALWLIFAVMNGRPVMESVINWFGAHSQQPAQASQKSQSPAPPPPNQMTSVGARLETLNR